MHGWQLDDAFNSRTQKKVGGDDSESEEEVPFAWQVVVPTINPKKRLWTDAEICDQLRIMQLDLSPAIRRPHRDQVQTLLLRCLRHQTVREDAQVFRVWHAHGWYFQQVRALLLDS
jgi:hypothetical protein